MTAPPSDERSLSDRLRAEAGEIMAHAGLPLAVAIQRLTAIYSDPDFAEAKLRAEKQGLLVTQVLRRDDGVIEVSVVPRRVAGGVVAPRKTLGDKMREEARARAEMQRQIADFEIGTVYGRRPLTALPLLAAYGQIPR